MDKHSIGKTISALRKSKGWTQVELAEQLNISDKTVSKWESEAGYPELTMFPLIADLFGVSIDYLMTGKEMPAEIITMSKAELCAKNDDISMLDQIDQNHIDESGHNLAYYVSKYESINVYNQCNDLKMDLITNIKMALIANNISRLERYHIDDRLDSIKLQFIKNIADDLEIEFAYREADKQAYALRQEALKKENMLKRACIKHSVGDNLVNIYFQPCSDDYDHTDIFLYIPEKTEETTTGGRYGPVKKENILSWVLIMKAGAEKGMFFKSITGLAYGRYAFIAKQFDKNNNLLVETDYIEFRIEKQYYFFGDQGNICVI